MASVTAGFKCAPEIGPKVRTNATSVPPVATVLARSAIATFPPASRSPMMPDPVSRNAVPRASATARRARLAKVHMLFSSLSNGELERIAQRDDPAVTGESTHFPDVVYVDDGISMNTLELRFLESIARKV
jgi:hypothetical protein